MSVSVEWHVGILDIVVLCCCEGISGDEANGGELGFFVFQSHPVQLSLHFAFGLPLCFVFFAVIIDIPTSELKPAATAAGATELRWRFFLYNCR